MPNLTAVARQRAVNQSLRSIQTAVRPCLPRSGLLAWEDLKPFLPFSRRTLFSMISAGRFPTGALLGNRRVWRAEDIAQWLDDTVPTELYQPA